MPPDVAAAPMLTGGAMFRKPRDAGMDDDDSDEKIEIAWKSIDSDVVMKMCNAVENAALDPLITVVDLTDNKLGPEGMKLLANSMGRGFVTDCIIRFNNVGKDGADSLSVVVSESSTLTHLDLRGNNLGSAGVERLLKAVGGSTRLQVFGLGGNDIGPEGAAQVAAALVHNTSITNLQLWKCGFGPLGASHIADLIMKDRSTTSLDLWGNRFGTTAPGPSGGRWDRTASTTSLDLWGNRFGPEGAGAVGRALGQNGVLTRISLGENKLGDAGAELLARGLARNRALTDLDVRSNQISPDGFHPLAAAVGSHGALRTLSLCNNPLGASGVSHIRSKMASCPSLTALDLWNCQIGATGASRLADWLAAYRRLQWLNLACNDIGEAGAHSVAQALPQCGALAFLDVTSNGIPHNAAELLVARVEETPSITSLSLHGNDASRALEKRVHELLSQRQQRVENRSDRCGQAGRDWLAAYRRLQWLNLACNDIGGAGAHSVAQALPQCGALAFLDVTSNGIPHNAAELLVARVEETPSITSLSLHGNDASRALEKRVHELLSQRQQRVENRGDRCGQACRVPAPAVAQPRACNDIGGAGAHSVAQALPQCGALAFLDVTSNGIPHNAAELLVARVEETPSITSLSLHGNDASRALEKRVHELLSQRQQRVESACATW
ncbi:RAN GTPase-activating protein 1 [Diplonema papillatum]|nr:RAN GTPase-activating protein 1 [Diplonema papillatum]